MTKSKKNIVKHKKPQLSITFWLKYHTQYKEQICLFSDHPIFKNNPFALTYFNDSFWKVTIHLQQHEIINEVIPYYYYVTKNNEKIAIDKINDKSFNPSKLKKHTQIIDSWNNTYDANNVFFLKPFKEVLLKNNVQPTLVKTKQAYTHTFKVKAPLLPQHQTICLLGNIASLQNWDTQKPLLLQKDVDDIYFSIQLNLNTTNTVVEYKYGVYDTLLKKFIHYEEGENRILYDTAVTAKNVLINDGFVVLPFHQWKGAGIAIPVFSIRTENSFGIGEFLDIKLLTDWAKQIGIKLIQLLPIHDTTVNKTCQDAYPYAANSAFALHPIYINIESLLLDEHKELHEKYLKEKKQFNKHTSLQYSTVIKTKWVYLQKIFHQQKEKTFASAAYKKFFQQNKFWLQPYAAFCYLRDEYNTANFHEWTLYKNFNQEDINSLTAANSTAYNEIAIHYFVQFYLDKQLKQAVQYAHENGIVLKGDLPIGLHKFSADVWQFSQLFNEQLQAGAPPDAFATKGQNWGFPTYCWLNMKANNFQWWQKRLWKMNEYFDAFRIDHILGFFRIWSIPAHALEGIMGYFEPAIPIYKKELVENNISFNHQRFTQPYITDELLQKLFAEDKVLVTEKYLIKNNDNTYQLKEKYATQMQVQQAFDELPDNIQNQKIKLGLYDLISNVLFFEVPNSKGEEFHCRFDMDKTFSFQQLDNATQQALKKLYNNYFFERQEQLWANEALEKLPTLQQFTNMLICAEDLGFVPAILPSILNALAILSLEVQRMPKQLGKLFSHPNNAPYLSVVTPSTHDMSTIRAWWEEDKNITNLFYQHILQQKGNAPTTCEPWINQAIIIQHLYSPAIFSIFQLQDLIGNNESLRNKHLAEERINNPATNQHNWQYRMHLTVEYLLQQSEFNATLKKQIQLSGR